RHRDGLSPLEVLRQNEFLRTTLRYAAALRAEPSCHPLLGRGRQCGQLRSDPARYRLSSGCYLYLYRFLAPDTEILASLLVDLSHTKLDFTPVVEPKHLDLYRIA